MAEAPAPKHTHGEGLRAHPGRRAGGLGLVGIDGRSPEQVVIRTATAVAREGGVGTAVEQTTFCTLDLRSSSAVTQIFGLYCMPGVAARRLQALGATRGWGVAETGGAPGMVGRFGWQRGAGAGGGRAPGARGGGGGGGGGDRGTSARVPGQSSASPKRVSLERRFCRRGGRARGQLSERS